MAKILIPFSIMIGLFCPHFDLTVVAMKNVVVECFNADNDV